MLSGQPWVPEEDRADPFRLDADGVFLMPYFRPEAVDLARDDGLGFPSPGGTALHDFLCSFLAAW